MTLISIAFWRTLCVLRKKTGKRWPHWLYQLYLSSRAWKRVRKHMLWLAGNRCEDCKSADGILQVHHETYENLGWEPTADLTVLCYDCHNGRHGK